MMIQAVVLTAYLFALGGPINTVFCPQERANHPIPWDWSWNITVSSQSSMICTDQGLGLYDVSQLPIIRETGFFDPMGIVPMDAAFYGNFAVISGVLDIAIDPPGPRPGMLIIADISIPSQTIEISRIAVGEDATDIKVQGAKAYVAAGSLYVIDLSSVDSPVIIGKYPCGGARNVFIVDTLAFVACGDGGLSIIDISVPSSPRPIGHADVPTGAHAIAVSRGKAFVASHGAGLYVLDVSIPSRPRRIGANNDAGTLCDIAIRANSLFAPGCEEYQGWLLVYDISNPMSPKSIDWKYTTGYSGKLALSMSNLFLVSGLSTIIYELIPCPISPFPGDPPLNN